MGSTNRPESNSAANLISLCRSCHEWIESNRTEALEHGWLVPQAQEPAEVDIWWRGKKARLDDLGGLVLL